MLKRSLAISAASALAQLIVAALYIVVARLSTPGELGGVVAAIAAGTFLAGFLDFGTNNYWIRQVASERMPLVELFDKIASKNLIALLVGVSIAISFMTFSPNTHFYAVGILAFTTVMFQSRLVPLKAAGKGSQLSAALAMERIFAGAAFVAILAFGLPAPTSLIIALAIGSILASLLAYHLASVPVRLYISRPKLSWPWRGSLSYGVGGALIAAQSLDATILHAVAGPAATGVYGAVNRWTQPMGVFASAFSTVGLPVVARSGSLRASYATLRNSWWLLGLGAMASLLVASFAPALVALLLGPAYRDSANVLAILAIATIPSLINQPLYAFLQALNMQKQVAVSIGAVVILQLSLCALLGRMHGEMGAALALALAQSCLFVALCWIARSNRK